MYIYGINNLLGMYSACQKFDFLGHRHHEYERINLIELRYLSEYNGVVQSPEIFLPGVFLKSYLVTFQMMKPGKTSV
jgi:hypothetical protein